MKLLCDGEKCAYLAVMVSIYVGIMLFSNPVTLDVAEYQGLIIHMHAGECVTQAWWNKELRIIASRTFFEICYSYHVIN